MEKLIWALIMGIIGVACTIALWIAGAFIFMFLGALFIEYVWPILWSTIKAVSHIGLAAIIGFVLFGSVAWIVEKGFDHLGLKKDADI
jgi:hypothetical protein